MGGAAVAHPPDGRLPLILAALGAILVAVGVGMVSVPVAVVVLGLEMVAGGWSLMYLRVRRAAAG